MDEQAAVRVKSRCCLEESDLCSVYLCVSVCPTWTCLKQHACKSPGHRQEETVMKHLYNKKVLLLST